MAAQPLITPRTTTKRSPQAENPLRIVPLELTRTPTTMVTTRSFAVTPIYTVGPRRGDPQIHTVANKHQQDVVDVIPFFFTPRAGYGDDINIVTYEESRPVLTARPLLGSPRHPVEATGRMVNLPGQFIEKSISSSLASTLHTRLGVAAVGAPFMLGGASVVLPNSPEVAFSRAIQVAPPQKPLYEMPGGIFGPRIVKTFSLSDIVERSLTQENPTLFDIRLLEATFSIAEAHERAIHLPSHLKLSGTTYERSDISRRLRVLRPRDLRELLSGKQPHSRIPSQLELMEVPHPAQPYLKEYRLRAQLEGKDTHTEINAELIAQEGVDRVVMLGWCLIKDKNGNPEPYLLANVGARTALAARVRESRVHPMAFKTNERHVEAISAPVGDARSDSELQALAEAALLKETGFRVIPGSTRSVMHGFRSPAFSPDCDHIYIAQIDPTSFYAKDQKSDTSYSFLIKASDIRDLKWKGGCPDLLLNLAAALVERGVNPQPRHRKNYCFARAHATLQKLTDSSSQMLSVIADCAPQLFQSPASRAQVRLMTERLGQDFRVVRRGDEKLFFSPLSPDNPIELSDVGASQQLLRTLLIACHDTTHFFLGEFIPVKVDSNGIVERESDGTARMQPRSINREILMCNEAYALHGDVEFARLLGVDHYEQLDGGVSAARIFEDLKKDGPYNRQQELAALYQMVVKGRLPEEIMRHPNYPYWREVILDKLLGYYVRDQKNVDLMYDYWQKNPEVAQAALDFCPRASANAGIFRGRYELLHQNSEELREGFNPFRTAVERLRVSEIPRIAMNLALIKSLARQNNFVGLTEATAVIDQHYTALRAITQRLEAIIPTILNCDPSDENLAIADFYAQITEDLLPQVEASVSRLSSDPSVLTVAQIKERSDKQFYLIDQPIFSTEAIRNDIRALERENFAAAGLQSYD